MEERLLQYFELLRQWNAKVRLIGTACDAAHFEREHVEDVRHLLPQLAGMQTLLDLGTGAGIPGLIIKILSPDIHVTVLDATRKKIAFCEEAIRRLDLGSVRAICGRAEDPEVARGAGRFDAVVSRATWKISEYLRISNSYIDSMRRSRIFALKGGVWREELDAAGDLMEELSLRLIEAHSYRLTNGRERSILIFGPK